MNKVSVLAEKYSELLSKSKDIQKPKIPKIDLSAYTDNDYLPIIKEINKVYEKIDDLSVTLQFLTDRNSI